MASALAFDSPLRTCLSFLVLVPIVTFNIGFTTSESHPKPGTPVLANSPEAKYGVSSNDDMVIETTLKQRLKSSDRWFDAALCYGLFLADRNRLSEAEALYKSSIETTRKLCGIDSLHESWLRSDLAGNVYRKQKRFDEAEPQLKEVLRIRLKRTKKDSADLWQANNALAWHFFNQSKFLQAEPYFIECVRIGDHGGWSLENLADCYIAQENYSKAQSVCEKSVQVSRMQFGSDSEPTAQRLSTLAYIYQNLSNYSSAEFYRLEALRISKKLYGQNSIEVATALNRLGRLYVASGRFQEAENLFLSGIKIATPLKNGSAVIGFLRTSLAQLYSIQGRSVESVSLLEKAIADFEPTVQASNYELLTMQNNLGAEYIDTRQYAQAERLLRGVLVRKEELFGALSRETTSPLNNLGCLYEAQNRFLDAEQLFKRAIQIRRAHPPGFALSSSLHNLGHLYCGQERIAEAANLYEEALKIEQCIDENDYQVAITSHLLADVFSRVGRVQEAETLCRKAILIRQRIFGAQHESAISSVQLLSDIQARKQ